MNEFLKRILTSKVFIKTVTNSKYVVDRYYSKASVLTSNCSRNSKTVNNKGKQFKVRKVVQNKLVKLLDIKAIEALEIVTTNKKFTETPCDVMSKNYELCILNKIGKAVVLKYPYILIDQSLPQKIDMLKKLSVKLTDILPLVQLTVNRLDLLCQNKIKTTRRIYEMCRIFNIKPSEACEILAKKSFLLYMTSRNIEEHLELFTENGISKEDLLRDIWVFKYGKPLIRSRLQCIKDHKVETIKTWMIHCPEETLFKHIKKKSDTRNILGEHSVAEYLSERLECSENIAKYIIRKQPQLQTKSLLKLNEMIDFLYKQGYTPSQICRVPKVLLHSTETAKIRIKELDALGKKPEHLYVLTKSKKQYMQHVENLIKTKKAKSM